MTPYLAEQRRRLETGELTPGKARLVRIALSLSGQQEARRARRSAAQARARLRKFRRQRGLASRRRRNGWSTGAERALARELGVHVRTAAKLRRSPAPCRGQDGRFESGLLGADEVRAIRRSRASSETTAEQFNIRRSLVIEIWARRWPKEKR
jgi:ParB-like chromosome segregation protein Spo0J